MIIFQKINKILYMNYDRDMWGEMGNNRVEQ